MNKKLLVILTLVLVVILISFSVIKIKNDKTRNINPNQSPESLEESGYNKYNEYGKEEKIDISVDSNNSSLCENACANYILKCMDFDPNTSPELIAQSINECMKECAKWDNTKKKCVLDAIDCESMTNVCGL